MDMLARSKLALLLVGVLSGCARTPQQAVEELRDSACQQDLKRFAEWFDLTTIARNALPRMRKDKLVRAFILPKDDQRAAPFAEAALTGVLRPWAEDVARGAAGHTCRLAVVAVTAQGETAVARIRLGNGKELTLHLSRGARSWRITDMDWPQAAALFGPPAG